MQIATRLALLFVMCTTCYAKNRTVLDDRLNFFDWKEALLGGSTYESQESFERNTNNLFEKNYADKVEFIDKQRKLWKYENLYEEAEEYFDFEKTSTVKCFREYMAHGLCHCGIFWSEEIKSMMSTLADHFFETDNYKKAIE